MNEDQPSLTEEMYRYYSAAYTFFNERLFEGRLPSCLFTFSGTRTAKGHYYARRFYRGRGRTDEIAINPMYVGGRSRKEVLGTLVHEMVHLWQQHFGEPSRNNYHNKQWAAQMRAVGLTPTHNGRRDGDATGQRMTHLVDARGPFDVACDEFLASRPTRLWAEPVRESKPGKTQFRCEECGQNAWAKPSAQLVCGRCDVRMSPPKGA